MKYAPFNVQNAGSPPENVKSPVDDARTGPQGACSIASRAASTPTPAWTRPAPTRKSTRRPSTSSSRRRKDVFSLDKDVDGKPINTKLKEEYGSDGFGRAALLARKLVEAGTAAVQITLGGWDLHNNTHSSLLRPNMLPSLDRAMGTLVKDLNDRGKLKDTVIVWMGDFGRTPRINQNAGRDHWAAAGRWSWAAAAIKGGVVHGATNADGTGIAKDETSVADLYGTLYRGLGIDPTPETNASVRDNLGRPYYIASEKPNEKTGSYSIKSLVS